MLRKSFYFFILALFVLVFFLAGWLFWRSHGPDQPVLTPPFVYEDFLHRYPTFSQEKELSSKRSYRELAHELEPVLTTISDPQDLAYGRYVVARAYVNAVRQGDMTDRDSLDRALALSRATLADDRGLAVFVIDLVDTLLYPHMSREVIQTVMNDEYFQRFQVDTDGAAWRFRENLLMYGDSLRSLSNIKMKLALIRVQGFYIRTQSTTNKMNETQEKIRKENILRGLREADAILRVEMQTAAPFHNPEYLVEPLYVKASVADYYYRATRDLPFGPVDPLYAQALEAADRHFPTMRPLIEQSQRAFHTWERENP